MKSLSTVGVPTVHQRNEPMTQGVNMNSAGKAKHFPYKHAVSIAVLACLSYWLYTPPAFSLANDSERVVVELEIPLDNAQVVTSQMSPSSKIEAPLPNLVAPELQPPINDHRVTVQAGDTLSVLFDRLNLGQNEMLSVLSSDESLLALETLRPGQSLIFQVDNATEALQSLELYFHPGHRVIYHRNDEDSFRYEVILEEGEWASEIVSGSIDGSFYLSAQRAQLSEVETATVTEIFQDQIDFARSIRKGDVFQVVRSVNFVDGQPTGKTRIDSAKIIRRAKEHTAFLFTDGRYYDHEGNSLARAFLRIPLNQSYRISSPFNPRRVHPITGKVGPHNGTDFATPTGTKVLSTGDGVVTRVGNHPFAGKYIDIKHGGQYKSRYLHLHKVLVRRGQEVSRGQVIAQSGNSGRSTGPHLHYELHLRGRPINPMKAKIPTTKSIPKADKERFAQLVAHQLDLLSSHDESTDIAANTM